MAKLTVAVSPEDHAEGNREAVCTLVEYGDYECPHCGAAYQVVKRLQKHFGDRLCFVFRNFPLSQMHPHAEVAAQTAEFAGSHGKFWEMHDLLFENQNDLELANLHKLTKHLHLVPKELDTALESQAYQARVRADFVGGVRSGVNGTPTFFLNGRRIDRGSDYQSLLEVIEEEIAKTQ
ncbi:DsbA family protein [Acidicapsa ligni]|uniref:DsbA family protein n=1 Tax=Acidicapsa ligni TaxID=542300 RepID=UPI0021DF6564|nr:DsbA family protein [Acidicapsa ligni]